MSFLSNMLSSVIANAAFWFLLGLAFWSMSKAAQHRFARFFDVSLNRTVNVWLSNLWHPGSAGRPVGYNISKHELRAAQSISELFASAPTRLPDLVRWLVDALWLRDRIKCVIEVSPPSLDYLPGSVSTFVIGACTRNSVRRELIEQQLVHALLAHETPEGEGLPTDKVNSVLIMRAGKIIQSIESEKNIGIVEKNRFPGKEAAVICCAGARADSTWGAAEYLVRNWKQLEHSFKSASFVICLGFPKLDPYPEEYVEPEVMASIKL